MKSLSRLKLWQQVLLISLVFAGGIFLLGVVADQAVNDRVANASERTVPHTIEEFRATFMRYDTLHYRSIAESGYQSTADTAFFPLYPSLVRGMSALTSIAISNALFVVSIISFLAAMIVTAYWLRYELRQRKVRLSPLYVIGGMLIFPTSFYLVLGYTESLFVLLTVGALYTYRTKHYYWSMSLMALAAVCRVQGVVIAVFFLADYFLAKKWSDWRKLLPVIGALIGIAGYMIWLAIHFGSALSFVTAQQSWGRLNGNIISGLISSFTPSYIWYLPVLALGLVAIYRQLGIAWLVAAGAYFLLPLASGNLDSLNRFMIGFAPLFLALAVTFAKRKNQYLKLAYIVSAAMLLAFNITLFCNGYFVG